MDDVRNLMPAKREMLFQSENLDLCHRGWIPFRTVSRFPYPWTGTLCFATPSFTLLA